MNLDKWLEDHPVYIATIGDNGFTKEFSPDPDCKHYLVLDMHRHLFRKFGKWEFFPEIKDGSVSNKMPKLPCPKSLWDGIGCMLGGAVFLVQDQPLVEDNIWLMYDILGGLHLLGRLNSDCELYVKALPLFRSLVAG